MLKKILLLFLIFPFFVNSQIRFEKGYFITEDGKRIECFIKNVDWLNNPTKFEYKASLDETNIILKSTDDVKEFGVNSQFKFVKAKVLVDKSREYIKAVSDVSEFRDPIWEEETIMLKVLVQGIASLYYYHNLGSIRFFYNKNNSKITQLVFKEYSTDGLTINKNLGYKNELVNFLTCEKTNKINIERLEYNERDLVNYFTKYNDCFDTTTQVSSQIRLYKKERVNFNFVAGLNYSNIESSFRGVYQNNGISTISAVSPKIALQVENILSFHNSKWSVLANLTYENFRVYNDDFQSKPDFQYNQLLFDFGFRHYMFVTKKTAFFASLLLEFKVMNKTTENSFYGGSILQRAQTKPNLGFGISHGKINVELKYRTSADNIYTIATEAKRINNISTLVSYRIF